MSGAGGGVNGPFANRHDGVQCRMMQGGKSKADQSDGFENRNTCKMCVPGKKDLGN